MWWCGEDWKGVAHDEQKGAGDGGDGGGGARGSGQSKSRNGNGMGREGSSTALEPEEMRRGAHTGNAMAMARWRRQSRGTAWRARKRAREGELERRSGWGRRVEKLGTGGGAGERPRCSTWPGKRL
jgi:hypothetical protein